MKKFIIMVLCVSIFFIGLGGLVDKAGAKFKSDERALEVIRLARIAIGGDANINNVRSLTIVAKTTKNFEFDGVSKIEQGDLEINLQLPNKFGKMLRFGEENGANGGNTFKRDVKVFVMQNGEEKTIPTPDKNGNVFIFRKDGDKNVITENNSSDKQEKIFIRKTGDADRIVVNEGNTNGDGKKVSADKKVHVAGGKMRHNELFRTTFSLLLSAPEGLDVNYIYAGEGDVDGNSCDIILAQTGGESFKLFLDKSTHLPQMMSYQGIKPLIFKIKKDEMNVNSDKEPKVFVKRGDAPKGEIVEFQVRFSDYRSTGDIQLPHKWTQTVGGRADETIEVSGYEINPVNIADKFKELPQMIRTEKQQ